MYYIFDKIIFKNYANYTDIYRNNKDCLALP